MYVTKRQFSARCQFIKHHYSWSDVGMLFLREFDNCITACDWQYQTGKQISSPLFREPPSFDGTHRPGWQSKIK